MKIDINKSQTSLPINEISNQYLASSVFVSVDVYVMHNRRKCTVFLESPTDGKSTWIYMPILNVPSAKRSLTPKEI